VNAQVDEHFWTGIARIGIPLLAASLPGSSAGLFTRAVLKMP